jgi:hypothetical protein
VPHLIHKKSPAKRGFSFVEALKFVPEFQSSQSKKRGFCFASFFKHLGCLKNGAACPYAAVLPL